MSTSIPDLWSDDIKVDVVPPLAILRAQTGYLERKTQGLLLARVSTTKSDNQELHALDLIAPALNQYRKTLLVAKHPVDTIYPVIVQAKAFIPPNQSPLEAMMSTTDVIKRMSPGFLESNERRAYTQDEFLGLVREVLRSGHTRSIIQSLIARSNEATAAEADRNGSPQTPPEAERDSDSSAG